MQHHNLKCIFNNITISSQLAHALHVAFLLSHFQSHSANKTICMTLGEKKNYMTKLMREKRKGYFSSGQAAMVHSQTYKPCPSAAEEWLKAAYSIHSHPKELKKARRKVSLPTIFNSPTILIENHYLHWADNVQKFIRLHSKRTRKKYIETDSFRCGVTQKNSCDVYYYCS